MLPILRILPVGGVLLAILILVLALSPPDGSRAPLSSAMATGRGILADRDRQSEMRQFLIHAALKRADELNRLRDLPDTAVRSEEAPPKVAGLPSDRADADPEETATTPETPVVSIPIEIGEPSSVELPAIAPQALPQTSAARGSTGRQESRAGQTAAGSAPPRLPRSPADKSRRQAGPVSPVQFLRDAFLGTAGSTNDLRRPSAG